MKISELKPNTPVDLLVVDVVDKGETREFSKFGNTGKVCTITIKDESGTAKMSLWNEDTDKISKGDKIELKQGWAKEYRGEMQASTGRNGTLTVLESGKSKQEKPEESEPEETEKTTEPEKEEPITQEDLAVEEETI
ncbi:MAG: Single-stranded DNA binding protein Ssb [Candidatus Woesearchaeota archaeon]|nr:Single-stranded DNA binding protein Ssb [Candidatus Woesearchaeota archaeon]